MGKRNIGCYKKSRFNISIEIIEEKEFFEICKFEINKIQEEIKEKERILSRYGMAIDKMKDTENLVKMLEWEGLYEGM